MNASDTRHKLTAELDLLEFHVPRADSSLITAYLCLGKGEQSAPKPVIIMLHGSGASSVFPRKDGKLPTPLLFHPLCKLRGEWNLLFVEKRGVTLGDFAAMDGISGFQGCSAEYVQHATRQERVEDVSRVVNSLAELGLHDESKLLLVGSSEGSDVAPGVAAANAKVTHLALFAYSAGHGLYDLLLALRGELDRGEVTEEAFHQQYEWLIEKVRDVRENADSADKELWGHSYRRWASYCFGQSLADLLKVEIPLYLAQGSLDHPESMDWAVAEFVKAGKRNLTVRNYIGHDHGFFKHEGDRVECRHDEVVADLMQWLKATEAAAKAKAS